MTKSWLCQISETNNWFAKKIYTSSLTVFVKGKVISQPREIIQIVKRNLGKAASQVFKQTVESKEKQTVCLVNLEQVSWNKKKDTLQVTILLFFAKAS